MKSIVIVCTLLITASILSCKNGNNRNYSAEPIPVQKDQASIPDTNTRKLIKEADLNFSTDDIEATAIQVRLIATAHNAYISEESRFEYEKEKGYNMTLRIPAPDFDKAMNEILSNCPVKKLINKSVRANDVTEEFVDVEIRLKIKKETEAHYLELLKQARNLEETLALEEQLSNLRTEIESAEGRLKFLSNQVDYSTIHISFSERKSVSGRFFQDLLQGFRGGWQVFLKIVIGLSYLWVVILLFVVFWVLYRRNQRGRKARCIQDKR